MKRVFSILAAVFVVMIAGLTATAQPMGGGMHGGMPGGMPFMPMGFSGSAVDMSEVAQAQTDMFKKELGLNDKQCNKIYKIYLNELDRRVNQMLDHPDESDSESGTGFGAGFPGAFPGGMPGGMPGGPGMGRGFPGGMPGAAEGEGDSDENTTTQMSNAMRTAMKLMQRPQTKADAKANVKIAKKMSKILTPEQYAKWEDLKNRPLFPAGQMRGGNGQGRPQGQGHPQGRPNGPQN